jgi:hypothetical protein
VSVSKIQAAISHPSLLTQDRAKTCAVSELVTHYTYRPGNLRDEIPKRRRLWPIPGCNAMKEEEEEYIYTETLCAVVSFNRAVKYIHTYII